MKVDRPTTHLVLLISALLPLVSEAFMHHPGMYGNNYGESSSAEKVPET